MDNKQIMQLDHKNRPMTMLEYCKLLLTKISFSEELLNKEYKKGLKYLDQREQAELKKWLDLNGKKIS